MSVLLSILGPVLLSVGFFAAYCSLADVPPQHDTIRHLLVWLLQ